MMNRYNLTNTELAHLLRTYEYELSQEFHFKDNAFDYDLDGLIENIKDNDKTFDFIWDYDTILQDNKTFCKWKLHHVDPRDNS
jgi:hypothetical protein